MKLIKKIVFGFLIFVGVGLLVFYFFQEKLLFLPGKKLDQNTTFSFPEASKEVNLKAHDGETINALYFTLENPKGIILFFHGNKGNLQRWGKIVPYLLEYNYEVFVIDYRGYGKSTGNFNEKQMYEDALTAYKHVNKLYSEDKIVVYGRSLGSTFAARVGADNNPKHVVLEAPFYNMKKASQFYFFLSPTFLLKYPFRTDKDIKKITVPLTIFHGDKDKVTSFKGSQELFKLAKAKQNEYVALQNGTHHNLKGLPLYKQKLKEILE